MKTRRERLLIGIGERFHIDRVFVLDEGYVTPYGHRCPLSYPYAMEHGGKLYITYSYGSEPGTEHNRNCNDAMLAVIPVRDL